MTSASFVTLASVFLLADARRLRPRGATCPQRDRPVGATDRSGHRSARLVARAARGGALSPETGLRRGGVPKPTGYFEQTVVILSTRRTRTQVDGGMRVGRGGILASELQFDVGIENIDAYIASEVPVFGSQQVL